MNYPRRPAHTTLVALVASVIFAAGADAQVIRQTYIGVGYSDGWTALFGFQFLKELSADEDARVVEAAPSLIGYAAGGVRTNPDDLTAQFAFGVVFPTDGAIPYWGPVALGSLSPIGGGVGVRLGAGFGAGLAWLTAGVMKLDERGGASAHVNVDLTTAFLCDITQIC